MPSTTCSGILTVRMQHGPTGYPYQGISWRSWNFDGEHCSRRYGAPRFEVHGPAQIAGDFFRVIKFTTERGGHGMTCQVWKQGHWTIYEDGPGGDQILQAHRADAQLLAESGVDDGPLPEDSDPNAVM